ncbi:hypothetical protein ONE63_011074 [Megalurothrips usitatus]|uniref:Cytochrome P450 6k1-like n=1 Tax=Megalurothrips usitatus TaxID=439358 RepID=A0AAV7XGW6_9NEOP|nr:hypothetical protein ONE63_011074 [Megalurothrips usitatus]
MLDGATAWISWCSVALNIFVASYLLWIHTHWARRGVPHARPRFLVGNFWDSVLQRRTRGDIVGDIYRAFDSRPFVGVYKPLMRPAVLLRDPALIQEVLVKNFRSFQNTETVFPADKDEVFSDNPFMADSERWKELRLRLSQAFTPARVRLAFDDMAGSGRKLVELLLAAGDRTSQDADKLAKRYATHAFVQVLFGIEANTLKPGEDTGPFYGMGHKIVNADNWLIKLRFTAFFYCPSLLNILGYEMANPETLIFFRKLILDSVQFRQQEGITRDDFIQHAAKLILVDGKVDDEALRASTARVINAFLETFETVSSSMAATFVLLAAHPGVQDKLRAELRGAFPTGRLTAHDELVGLPYLDCVCKEAMRVFPTADPIKRTCTKSTVLQASTGEAVSVRQGDTIYVSVEAVQHDPAYYSHADEFYPDHFSEEEIARRPKCTYLVFGEGPRMCPGNRFGMLLIKVALASVLLHVEVVPGPELALPATRDPASPLLSIKGGPWLRFRPT